MQDNEWATRLAEKHSTTITKVAAREDLSLQTLESLLSDGYTLVTWQTTGPLSCSRCQDLNGQVWALMDFISGLRYAACLAERSHPNCLCTVVVSGDNLANVVVDYNGNMS